MESKDRLGRLWRDCREIREIVEIAVIECKDGGVQRALIRGGTICYFSVDIRDRFLGRMVLDAFCHNKTENNFENFKNLFSTPPTRGSKNGKNPL